MVWLRIDDQIAHHPKFLEVGPVASWLWLCGNAYCNKYLTDGFIKESALSTLGSVTNPKHWADRLVDVGLWTRVEGGFCVHDFHDFNPKAEDVRQRRDDVSAKRAASGRMGGVASGATRRTGGSNDSSK